MSDRRRWQGAMAGALLGICACGGDAPAATPGALEPTFDGADADRQRIAARLVPVGTGFGQVSDIQFPPGRSDVGVVLDKQGTARWFRPADGAKGEWFSVPVLTPSEQGLLGLAFHPDFASNGLFYVHYTPKQGERRGRIAEWSIPAGAALSESTPTERRVILEIPQPYANHNGGQLQFGPDGMLYIGTGDGGSGGDPHEHGQNRGTLLGSMLRIDVDRVGEGTPYAIPPDNPFVGTEGARPEIWAYGLRNPWRFTFTADGRLVAADVGQDAWEEITFVERGGNHGWDVWEARHCFEAATCSAEGMVMPFYEYGHDEGVSVTGGYVAGGEGPLAGKYVFADFAMGRFWAVDLPADSSRLVQAYALGKFPVTIATFGRDADGTIYASDFGGGAVYRLEAAPPR